MKERDFSNLNVWLPRKAKTAKLTFEQIAHRVGISRTMMYEYVSDLSRPTEQTMLKMCRVLGVPFEQGLSQYTPKKIGRPRGSNTTSELRVRRK